MRIAKVPNRKNPETLLKIEKYVKYNIIFDGECSGSQNSGRTIPYISLEKRGG